MAKIKKVYMIGIKGVGMTMLAQYFRSRGIIVTGSDVKDKFMTDQVLISSGVKIVEEFRPDNITKDADLIIYSTAYNENNNIELAAAIKGKIKIISYAEALAYIFNQKYGIAVAGSHGKTTASAWLGYIMKEAKLSPNVMVGANVPQFNGFSLSGYSDYLLVEIDEYQNKLKYFQPQAVLLNNIDYDHPDFFPTKDDYEKVFIEFIKKIPAKGFLVANYDDPIIRKIAYVNCRGKIITYAINEVADYIAYDITYDKGEQYFKVKMNINADDEDNGNFSIQESNLGNFSIKLLGKHNIYNALAVIAASIELRVDLFNIRKYLSEFSGTTRRLEILGKFKEALIIDDYAHHPTEIKTTLSGVRQKFRNKNLIVVFHPHTFTRTNILINDFAKSFDEADELIILDIYGSARESQGGVHSKDLIQKIEKRNKQLGVKQKINYIPTLDKCEIYLRSHVKKDDLVLLMGAGDVFRVGENLVKK